jgi:hypothetical protein
MIHEPNNPTPWRESPDGIFEVSTSNRKGRKMPIRSVTLRAGSPIADHAIFKARCRLIWALTNNNRKSAALSGERQLSLPSGLSRRHVASVDFKPSSSGAWNIIADYAEP